MLEKKDYYDKLRIKEALKQRVKKDPYRLGFHMMPPTGWLNDPNGLCYFKGLNHIYFQYTPFTPTWGIKLWGHYTTADWLTYTEEEPFLFPDNRYDKDGVYSGSAFVDDDHIHYFYTGNVKYTDKEYDYINDGREQNTIELYSDDAYTYKEKRLIFTNSDYPQTMSCHVRDPKVFEKDGAYYMVLGARSKADTGCALLYKSDDLKEWQYHMCIESEQPFGYMWECPDIFEVDGKTYLLCCPQGVAQDGLLYQNVYQCGMFELNLDLENKRYTLSSFKELDKGFDIYAPQTFLDKSGRRILLCWMGIPDADYHNEETIVNGWQHALTMPRILQVEDGVLCQKPLMEFQALRKHKKQGHYKDSYAHETTSMYEASIRFEHCSTLSIRLRDDMYLHYENQILTLDMGTIGQGRIQRCAKVSVLHDITIFMDTSCVEIFINNGSEVFTSRYYSTRLTPVTVKGEFEAEITHYELSGVQVMER